MSAGFVVGSGFAGPGAACPFAGARPFAPRFSAGVESNGVGRSSQFHLWLMRTDADEELSGLMARLPRGLVGRVADVVLCAEARAGAGSNPFYITDGKVFLTGPYKGAPFGVSIVVPAVAGSFDLGTVVVRAAIQIDRRTAQLKVVSDLLPTILDGIPLNVREVRVAIDRPGFMLNPTSCAVKHVDATITSVEGWNAGVSSRFQAAECASLGFAPRMVARTVARHSKRNGVAFFTKVTSGAGQANIARVKVSLPKILPSRLSTLNKACLAVTFEADPASCPAASVVGHAKAVTRLLRVPLEGPAYFVSHGGAGFPDMEIVLQGEGITIDLVGRTSIKNGVTSVVFGEVPDAPVASFELTLPAGANSALAATGDLCRGKLVMPTSFTGQNGAQINGNTRIAVQGCPKHKHKAKKRHK